MSAGRLFVISAPSGTGKTTVLKALLRQRPELMMSVSCTTRTPRPGEQDGVDYHFLDDASFRKMIEQGELVEWARVHDRYYGTPRAPLQRWQQGGRHVILDLDVQGAAAVRRFDAAATLVFLAPPSLEVLEQRLRGRGTEDPQALERRLRQAQVELAQRDTYDHVLVNHDVAQTCAALAALIPGRSEAG